MPTYPLAGWGCYDAGYRGKEESLAEHHRAGGSLDLGNYNGRRAAHGAAQTGEVGTLRFLDGNGADMNIRDKVGMTPLVRAARLGQLGAARMLVVDAGVDTTLTNTKAYDGKPAGLTAAQWAREERTAWQGQTEVAEFLEQHAAQVAAQRKAALVRALLVCAVVMAAMAALAALMRHSGHSIEATPTTLLAATAAVATPTYILWTVGFPVGVQQHQHSGVAASAVPSRMHGAAEGQVTMLPKTSWRDIQPKRSCISEMQTNAAIRKMVPKIDDIVDDVQAKLLELKWCDVPVKLSECCTAAIVAYTHDLGVGQDGNLYFELNRMLRERGAAERGALMSTWGGYMHYMMTGLACLPDFKGDCFRGYNYGTRAEILETYRLGRPIQWGAFTSVTTSLDAAKRFAPTTRVVFKIAVTSGRDINAYPLRTIYMRHFQF